ncbi:L-lactate permease [Persicimonas caeni]|uniref:L-lactate permease n=1 Tax=Persicimonas caeni TaxID=2292766 RepID=A0A4Y6PML9_PERCE|nr:L-lactate permease [Persicimonas caeni]QDG49500.1 L-lactate permease [Persicimonas caeni]QED30721.1 L-lactate permease [Persicimonas caeni]
MNFLDALLAALPILVVLALMVFAKRSAALAGAFGLLTSVVLAATYFDPGTAAAPGLVRPLVGAGAEAAFTAGTILWIIFGALCIYQLQQKTHALEQLRSALSSLSDDPRIVVILVAWFFALFSEGAAGFGTAVALSAPFLVGFGFRPADAVVITMLGHGIGVSFGAVGIPTLAQAELVPFDGDAISVPTATFHALIGWVMLVAMLRVATGDDEPSESDTDPKPHIWRWAAVAAACYLVPMYVIARFVGPELPTLGGSLAGGLLFVGLYRWFGGKKEAEQGNEMDAAKMETGTVLRAAAPYLAVIALVLLTRLVAPIADTLGAVTWSWSLWERFEGSMQPILHPGTILIAGFLIGAVAQRATVEEVKDSTLEALRQLLPVALALGAMLGLSRVMAHSGMIEALAAFTAVAAGSAWPFFSPWVGMLGTFVTGSATASNILFSEFQLSTTTRLSMPALTLLGTQNVGAAVGSIVAPSKIIAGGATVGIAGEEGSILRRLIGPAALYIGLTGIMALVAVYLL